MKFKSIAIAILVGAMTLAAAGCTSKNSQTTGACRTGNINTNVASCTIKTRASCELLKSDQAWIQAGNYWISFTPNGACF